MKLISLNTWGARAGKEKVLDFFKKYEDIDIFCLQEMWQGGEEIYTDKDGVLTDTSISFSLLDDIKKVLPSHDAYFRSAIGTHYGLAIFVKKNVDVIEEGDVFIHKDKGFVPEGGYGGHARNMQYMTIGKENPIIIYNVHGLWNGQGKSDSDDRLLQSDKITEFVKDKNNPFVLVGDFNLLPETESIKKIEQLGVENLIAKYNIKSTRTSLYTREIQFADYAFTSPLIQVKDFKVMKEEVSDHSALFLEF
jgi:exonuclease III